MTRSQPPAPARPPGGDSLADTLTELAGTADDDPTVGARLATITQLAADLPDPVAFASVTRRHESGYSTVAVSSELARAVLAAYDEAPGGRPPGGREDLSPGARNLIAGLLGAFAIRATIQQAIGMIIAARRTNADLAYALLRSQAAATTGSLIGAATEVVADGH